MASGERTEEATPKKLADARKRGEVPQSRELGTAAVMLATAAALTAMGPGIERAFRSILSLTFRHVANPSPAAALAVLTESTTIATLALAPLLLLLVAVTALAGFLQVGPLLSFSAIAPRLDRLDPIKGAQNLFGKRQWVELAKTLLKVLIVGWVLWSTLRGELRGVLSLGSRGPEAVLHGVGVLLARLFIRAGTAMAAIAILDVLYQRIRFRADQRMTKDEVKRESKESEGDPHAKQNQKRLYQELMAQATLAEVRKADVLVVNPTHYAIALQYDDEADDAAPAVLAKGQDELARRMIDAAKEAGVPIMRDVPLAHALYELEEGDEIPEQLYEAVAIVLQAAWDERDEGEEAR